MSASPSALDRDPRYFLEARYGARMRSGQERNPQVRNAAPAPAMLAQSLEAERVFAAVTASATPTPPYAVRVLNRLTFGPTEGDIALFNALASSNANRLEYYLDWQLAPEEIDDSEVESRLAAAGYTTLDKTREQLWTQHYRNSDYNTRMRPGWEVQRAKYVRAIYSKRQLHEVMTDFWHDHFNVFGSSSDIAPTLPQFDRVLRQNALGNFRAMLQGVAQSNAMLYYLDNVFNSRSGPNENWARELLELHTLGAENYYGFMNPFEVPRDPDDPSYPAGYTDIDVYETASAFTGWSIANGHWQFSGDDSGSFSYRASWHDQGPKFVLGMLLNPEQPAMADGLQIIERLASHPKVARSICKKLIQRLIGGEPPAALVTSAAKVFRDNYRRSDQIARTVRHIVLSSRFRNTWGLKVKRPFEYMVAAMRAIPPNSTIRLDHQRSNDLMWRMSATGNVPFAWPAPDGYPDRNEAWLGSNSMVMTWKALNWLTGINDGNVAFLPIVHLSRRRVSQWTAKSLVDYWCRRILGYQLIGERRLTLISFMAQNGGPDTLIEDSDVWAGNDLKRHYNHQRLKSMVSLIMMSLEFSRR